MPRRTFRWLARHPWVTSLITVTVFALAAVWRDASYDGCVSAWSDQVVHRSSEVGKASDRLWRTVADLTAGRAQRADFDAALANYIHTSDAYPVPASVGIQCGRW